MSSMSSMFVGSGLQNKVYQQAQELKDGVNQFAASLEAYLEEFSEVIQAKFNINIAHLDSSKGLGY